MPLIVCPKCKKIINSAYYPKHWEGIPCARCRYRETRDTKALNELVGPVPNEEEWMKALEKAKEHYDAAPEFNDEEWKLNEYGEAERRK